MLSIGARKPDSSIAGKITANAPATSGPATPPALQPLRGAAYRAHGMPNVAVARPSPAGVGLRDRIEPASDRGSRCCHQPLGGGGVGVLTILAIVQSCVWAACVIGSTSLVDVTVTEWPAWIEASCVAVSVIVWVWFPSFDEV